MTSIRTHSKIASLHNLLSLIYVLYVHIWGILPCHYKVSPSNCIHQPLLNLTCKYLHDTNINILLLTMFVVNGHFITVPATFLSHV